MRKGIAVVSLAAAAALSPTAGAHHSPVMFDQSRTVTLEGTVRQFQWTNPHCYIQLLVGDGADQTEWNVEMGAPIYLQNLGWRRTTLQAGDRVRITAAPLRKGGNGGLVLEVVSLDGRALGRARS